MNTSVPENNDNTGKGVSRRTLVKGAAWSLPVVAAAVATPLAAASPELAALTYSVAPLVDVYAPYGATSMTVTNNSTVDYVGPITFTTPSWTTIAPFALTGAIRTTDGTNTVWTLPAATIAAGKSLVLDLTWAGPNPPAAETQPLTVTVDPALGTATPAGTTTIDSPYALLWYSVTPGADVATTGTKSFFIGNTTDTALTGMSDFRTEVFSFPQQTSTRITTNGVAYPGTRVALNGQFVIQYLTIPVNVSAMTGNQEFVINWAPQGVRQARKLVSVATDTNTAITPVGDMTLYTPGTPA